ncbi:hypothetical protein EDD36DRAFT_496654 [Exophiala viscosa]|uniref:tyrosinase n=1 Tax=Exophiala viscosa TaxID=2486360 RepID=A0AAN6DS14_9EURO|nr:hypothetical protein EDD36DRAFT_496654 [Exophiala viscosa]
MAIDINYIEESIKRGITVGVVPLGGATRTRKEIDEFIKDTECFNLYLLALIDLQRLPGTRGEEYFGTRRPRWNAAFSYFQMAGIHGKPFHPWDGLSQEDLGIRKQEGKDAMNQPSIQAGYCSHSSDLFPTWHRAYLAMYEQSLFLQMVNIARAFPPQYQKRYLDACEDFGIPYWDPFLPRRKILNKYGYPITKCGIPVIMSSKDVRIRTPRQPDQPIDAPNPLYTYKFAPGNLDWAEVAGHPFREVFRDVINNPNMTLNTIRGPTPTGWTSHQYVNNTLTNAVSTAHGPALPLGSKIYRILQGPPLSYTQMATSAYVAQAGPSTNKENSLEGFHNDIHTMCGNGGDGRTGHMGLTEYAAFDPIFWLHHANIDRIFAIWQALNPDTWSWDQRLLDSPTYVRAIGDRETSTSWLIPFRRKIEEDFDPFADPGSCPRRPPKVEWWTSDALRRCSDMGYTYPELQLVKHGEKADDLRPLRQWVTDTYEWSTIYGEPPPWQSLFESEGFSRVEALPEVLRIDGTGKPISIETATTTTTKPQPKPIISTRIISWFHGRDASRNVGRGDDIDCYKHIRPLMRGHTLTHWNLTVTVRKFALNGSFQIYFFLGDFSDDPRTWPHERHLVGIDGIFANRHIEHCENCKRQDSLGLEDSDTIALTTNLVAYWKNEEVHCDMRLRSLEPNDVLPFLKYNLHWRVLDSYGRQHDARNIESLRVAIGSQEVRLPTEYGGRPEYSIERIWHDVATGA